MENNALIITVAGTCSRFRESLGRNVLKCIYSENQFPSILSRLINENAKYFKRIIVVGGHLFSNLEEEVKNLAQPKVTLIYNDHYSDWGSNYSLFLGLSEALKDSTLKEVVFAEGDLVFDSLSFQKIVESPKNVVTANHDPIHAVKSVAVYENGGGQIKFMYDTAHREFSISEPFVSIANSGQVWKFTNIPLLKSVLNSQKETDFRDTNLNFVQKYFNGIENHSVEMIYFRNWHNCNTVEDYRRAFDGAEFKV